MKHFTSRIPVTSTSAASGHPLFTAYSPSQCKKFTDKCTNTDIDLKWAIFLNFVPPKLI